MHGSFAVNFRSDVSGRLFFINDWKIFPRIYSDGAQQLNTRRHKHTGITAADRGE
jgi:hypothetical protein